MKYCDSLHREITMLRTMVALTWLLASFCVSGVHHFLFNILATRGRWGRSCKCYLEKCNHFGLKNIQLSGTNTLEM